MYTELVRLFNEIANKSASITANQISMLCVSCGHREEVQIAS